MSSHILLKALLTIQNNMVDGAGCSGEKVELYKKSTTPAPFFQSQKISKFESAVLYYNHECMGEGGSGTPQASNIALYF